MSQLRLVHQVDTFAILLDSNGQKLEERIFIFANGRYFSYAGHASHGTVVSTAASQRQGSAFDSRLGSLSVWSLHILPVSVCVSSGCSGFFPQSKRCAG